MALFEHWAWIPMAACVAIFCLWLTGCTLAQNSASSSPQPMPRPTISPPMTITVFETITTESAVPTRQTIVQIASPPPQTNTEQRIHTIQADDTLLDIAIRYDISLESLLLANPDVDPRALQIGQQLTIPNIDDSTEETTRPAPVPLIVSSPECYPTSTDSALCIGLIRNNQPQPVEQISLSVAIERDAAVIQESTVVIEQSFVEPGGIAPYRAIFNGVEAEEVERVVVTLQSAVLTNTINDRFANLDIKNDSLVQDGNRFIFSADIVNVGERTSQSPRLILTLLDADDRVYGYRIWEGNAPLFPEVSARAQLSILPATPTNPANLTYQLHAEARLVN